MMIEDSKTIDEVVVIGYGSVKKSKSDRSCFLCKNNRDTTNSYDFYRPRISRPGFRCTSYANFGYARSGSSIRVRGSSSLQGGNEPLYVIDGFPVYSGQVSARRVVIHKSVDYLR